MKHTLLFGFGAALFALGPTGCSGDPPAVSACPEWPASPIEQQPQARVSGETGGGTVSIDVAACSGGATQAEIDRNLELVYFLRDDFKEMITCGYFASQYSYSLSHYFAALACGHAIYPTGFSYTGSGFYIVGGGIMTLQAKLSKDSALGKTGDDVPFDLFDQSNYYSSAIYKATLELDTSFSTDEGFAAHLTGTIEMTAEEANDSALELFGVPTEGTTLKMQQEALAKAIGENVYFVVKINQERDLVKDLESHGGVKYQVSSPDTPVGDLFNAKAFELALSSIFAEDTEISQSTELVDWNMKFLPKQLSELNGSITVKMNGGKFPYYVRYSYPDRPEPDISVTCDPPAP